MSESGAVPNSALPGTGQRLDKFLWAARFLKSRSLASALCAEGRVRVSGRLVDKAHARVRVGDVLTFPLGARIRVVRILALPSRRGPASEAQALYEDLSPDPPPPFRPPAA
jgi:ribosome-associated heat shock protein Hsp15